MNIFRYKKRSENNSNISRNNNKNDSILNKMCGPDGQHDMRPACNFQIVVIPSNQLTFDF